MDISSPEHLGAHLRLREALAAIRAGDDAGARRALIDAWCARRSPALATLVELIDERSPDALHGQLREIVRPKIATSEDRLRAVADADDPRLSGWAIAALADPPFESKSAEAFLTGIVAIAARDPRLLDRRAEIVSAIAARIGNRPMRNRLIEAVDAAARALAVLAAASADELAIEAQIATALEPLRAHARSAAALLADIYANPDDDGPRLVYADLLLERGDPHGELIRLQLERGRAGPVGDRERWLLKQHGKDFLGALAPVLSFGWSYSRTELERGFVAVADFIGAGEGSSAAMRRRIELVVDAPAWATVEQLQPSAWTVELLKRAPLRALQRVDRMLSAPDLHAIAARAEPLACFDTLQLRATEVDGDVLPPDIVRRAFPSLATLVVFYDADELIAPARAARVGRFGAHRIVLDRLWSRTTANHATNLAHHQELIKSLVGAVAFVAELAIQPPWHARPKPAAVELRRGPAGTFTSTG